MNFSKNTFDIAIIGAGAAGLNLALAMVDEPFFSEKKILILEKEEKKSNDRTWCFWEKGAGKFDPILFHSWASGDFFSPNKKHLPLDLSPYKYKMLRSADFYAFAKKKVAEHPNFFWEKDEVLKVESGSSFRIIGQSGEYFSEYVFDGRLPDRYVKFAKFDISDSKHTHLLQHFKGWFVRTESPVFTPGRFTMMDFRMRWRDTTSFTYVLPFSETEALVEFTLFTESLITDEDYDSMLRKYFEEVLSLRKFEITEVEKGVIPMTDFPFEKYSNGKHLRIGTAGGWVKPSSGYSFKNCEKNARRIVENLKKGKPADEGLISKKFRFYDSIFLDVLNRRNELGPELFHLMYAKNDIQTIFRFLDDESNLMEDVGIISSFPKGPFLKSFFRWLV